MCMVQFPRQFDDRGVWYIKLQYKISDVTQLHNRAIRRGSLEMLISNNTTKEFREQLLHYT